MADLFIVRTPMQIVSAIEAMHYFHSSNNTLVIIYNKKKNNFKQIQKIIDIFHLATLFKNIIEVKSTQPSKFLLTLKLIRKFKKHSYNKLFIGLYDSMGKLFLANLSYQQAYLIDDGTATIVAHQHIVRTMHSQTVGSKELRALFFGLHTQHRTPLHFFTLFHLTPYSDETIITHRFEYLKQRFTQQYHHSTTIYLLGQNLTDVAIVSAEKYLCYIQQILKHYPDRNIVYIPHRLETLHPELYALQHSKFTVMHNTMPIELYFLTNRIYPNHIISFFTSALYTLNILFDEATIESFSIASEDIEHHHDSVTQCQKFLEETSVIQSPLQCYNDYKML